MAPQTFTMNLQAAMESLGRSLNPEQLTEAAKVDALRDIGLALVGIAEAIMRQGSEYDEVEEQGHTSLSDR